MHTDADLWTPLGSLQESSDIFGDYSWWLYGGCSDYRQLEVPIKAGVTPLSQVTIPLVGMFAVLGV